MRLTKMNILTTTRPLLRNVPFAACLFCQLLSLSSNPVLRQLSSQAAPPAQTDDADDKRDYTPSRLLRPLGLPDPPRKGENSGVDYRTLQERRDDFVNWDRHLEKRKHLVSQFKRSYFEDFNAMSREHKGKAWIAPPKLFRAEKALYFPNLVGGTLVPPLKEERDTTDVLANPSAGVVSVVAVFSSVWGEGQVKTFMDHPDIVKVLAMNRGNAQRVDINIEQNRLKAFILNFFLPSLRKRFPLDQHGKYFIVRRGVTDKIRKQVGLMNNRLGYVYLLDSKARIRWAASGLATDEERDVLVKGIKRLVDVGTEEDTIPTSGRKHEKMSSEPVGQMAHS